MKTLASLVFVVLVACGGSKPPPTVTPAPGPGSAEPVAKADPTTSMDGSGSGTTEPAKPVEEKKEPEPPPPPPPPEPDAFLKLTKDEKTKIMKTKVMPAMTAAFKKQDAKAFAKFGCKTCHGKGAETDFKMPNPDLPALDFEAMKAGKQNPKMAKFMMEHVSPEMAKILGVQGHDEQHPNGFGCLTCHTMKQ